MKDNVGSVYNWDRISRKLRGIRADYLAMLILGTLLLATLVVAVIATFRAIRGAVDGQEGESGFETR